MRILTSGDTVLRHIQRTRSVTVEVVDDEEEGSE
jgi:hypothetical protein